MIKKFTTGEYLVSNIHTGDQYFFQWRPTKKDLVALSIKENWGFGYLDCKDTYSITKIKYENPVKYGYKLRYR